MNFFSTITEELKKSFFSKPKISEMPILQQQTIDRFLTKGEDNYTNSIYWYDGDTTISKIAGQTHKEEILERQAKMIQAYRHCAGNSTVQECVDEIANEFLFTASKEAPVAIVFNNNVEISENIKKAFYDSLEKTLKLLNFDENGYALFKSWFIDGQLNIQVQYDSSPKKGITALNILTPYYLYYDKNDNLWKYFQVKNNKVNYFNTPLNDEISFKPEEIIKIDSNMYDDGILLSQMQYAIKATNVLETLEDMLVPMRFSHSVSRRIFNMDVSGLPAAKAQQAATEMQNKFKYKKYYDPTKGTISNSTGVNAIVEDYWVMSRDGAKGLEVQTLDESNNLGELRDIEYAAKNVYKALKIPTTRYSGSDSTSSEYDFGGMAITRDEIKFFSHISRLRKQFNRLFVEIMKRDLLYQTKMNETEFEKFKDLFKIVYSKENSFLDKLDTETFKTKLDTYNSVSELIGIEFSKSWVRKNILKMTDEEIDQMKKEIAEEIETETPTVVDAEKEEQSQWSN